MEDYYYGVGYYVTDGIKVVLVVACDEPIQYEAV